MRQRTKSAAKESDFHLCLVGDKAPVTMSSSVAAWLKADQVQALIGNITTVARLDFANELFSKAKVVGVLQCDITADYESHKEWLVLLPSLGGCPLNITLKQLIGAKDGEFVYLRINNFVDLEHPLLAAHLTNPSRTTVERFFGCFGGLRISMPHLGGTNFRMMPQECPPEMIAEKRAQKRWGGSKIFYVIDHCDYLILNKQGEVGFVPIDPNRLIEPYAPTFDIFLRRWLNAVFAPSREALRRESPGKPSV
jgi:hypothetical protein